jgi:hypothetical protein
VLQYRAVPHFAWTLSVDHASAGWENSTYVGPGARVFAKQSGSVDPFVELGVGVDHSSREARLLLAGVLGAGFSVALSDHVKLGPTLQLRQRSLPMQGCRLRPCRHASFWGERWLTLGLALELWLGPRH